MTRYSLLRESIAYFAASPEEQIAHYWGPDDQVNGTPYPLQEMLAWGEINSEEINIISPLETLIERYCASPGRKTWDDESLLFTDPEWAKIRLAAGEILKQLPNEERQSDWR